MSYMVPWQVTGWLWLEGGWEAPHTIYSLVLVTLGGGGGAVGFAAGGLTKHLCSVVGERVRRVGLRWNMATW